MQPKRKFSWTNQKLFTRKEKQAPVSRRLLCNVSNWNSVPIMHGQSVETCWDNRPFLFTLPKGPGKPSRYRRSLKRGEPFRRPCAWQLCLLSRFRSGMCGSSFFQSDIQNKSYGISSSRHALTIPDQTWPNEYYVVFFVALWLVLSWFRWRQQRFQKQLAQNHGNTEPRRLFLLLSPTADPGCCHLQTSSDYHTDRRMPIAFCVGEENDSLWFFHQVKPSKEAAAVLWDVTSSGQGLLHSKTVKRSRCSIVGRNVLRTRLAP